MDIEKIKSWCSHGKIKSLQEAARKSQIPSPESSLSLNESEQIGYYCYQLTKDHRYKCKNKDTILGEDIYTYPFSTIGEDQLIIDGELYCFTLGELEDLANQNRFNLSELRHPYLGKTIKDISLNYLDKNNVLVSTTYGDLLQKLVKAKTPPRLARTISGLERQFIDELNYGIISEISHFFAEIDDLDKYKVELQRPPNSSDILKNLKRLGAISFDPLVVGLDLHLKELVGVPDLKKLIKRFSRDNYTAESDFYSAYRKLLTQLVTFYHYYNVLYDSPHADKFILDHIKLSVIRLLKQGNPVPVPILVLLGDRFYFPYSDSDSDSDSISRS